MQLDLGLSDSVLKPQPSISDEDGYLEIGLCTDKLEYSVEIAGETKTWVYIDAQTITVKIPDTPIDIVDYLGSNTGTFVVAVDSVRLLEEEFEIVINEPDCTQLVLMPSPAAISNMAVTIG